MAVQMGFDLALCFGNKAQAPRVAHSARHQAQRESAGVPEGIEPGCVSTQCIQALTSPGEMVGFLIGRFKQLSTQRRVARGGCLRRVEGLGANFTDMVDSHQSARLSLLGMAERQTRLGCRGQGLSAGCMWRREQRAERRIGCAKEGVQSE